MIKLAEITHCECLLAAISNLYRKHMSEFVMHVPPQIALIIENILKTCSDLIESKKHLLREQIAMFMRYKRSLNECKSFIIVANHCLSKMFDKIYIDITDDDTVMNSLMPKLFKYINSISNCYDNSKHYITQEKIYQKYATKVVDSVLYLTNYIDIRRSVLKSFNGRDRVYEKIFRECKTLFNACSQLHWQAELSVFNPLMFGLKNAAHIMMKLYEELQNIIVVDYDSDENSESAMLEYIFRECEKQILELIASTKNNKALLNRVYQLKQSPNNDDQMIQILKQNCAQYSISKQRISMKLPTILEDCVFP